MLTDGAQVALQPAAARQRFTVLMGAAQAALQPATARQRSMVPMAGGLAPQGSPANAKTKTLSRIRRELRCRPWEFYCIKAPDEPAEDHWDELAQQRWAALAAAL